MSAAAPDLALDFDLSDSQVKEEARVPLLVSRGETASSRGLVGFDITFCREYEPGSLTGGRGLRIKATQPFEAQLTSGRKVVVNYDTHSEEVSRYLVLTLLGLPPLEWVNDVTSSIGSATWVELVKESGVGHADLDEFYANWKDLA